MATVKCAASDCNETSQGPRKFVHCEKCGSWWCSRHGSAGNSCPGCKHRYLKG